MKIFQANPLFFLKNTSGKEASSDTFSRCTALPTQFTHLFELAKEVSLQIESSQKNNIEKSDDALPVYIKELENLINQLMARDAAYLNTKAHTDIQKMKDILLKIQKNLKYNLQLNINLRRRAQNKAFMFKYTLPIAGVALNTAYYLSHVLQTIKAIQNDERLLNLSEKNMNQAVWYTENFDIAMHEQNWAKANIIRHGKRLHQLRMAMPCVAITSLCIFVSFRIITSGIQYLVPQFEPLPFSQSSKNQIEDKKSSLSWVNQLIKECDLYLSENLIKGSKENQDAVIIHVQAE